jgi:hypothetical protein
MLRVNQLNGFGVNRPYVIRNGLILYLDAGNTNSYPGSGTTWTDLSVSGFNGTLTNGPTFNASNGGSIVFDGTDDFVQCSGSPTVTEATFLVWIKRNGTQGSFNGIFYSRGTLGSGLSFGLSNQLGYSWNDDPLTYNWATGLTPPDAAWAMCSVAVTSSNATAYLHQASGLTSAVNTTPHASSTLGSIKIAYDGFMARYFNGNIAQAILYNRALSASEIAQNFDATRRRYGI